MSEICTMAKVPNLLNYNGSRRKAALCLKPVHLVALQLGYLFDHPGTVLFSVFMSFWAVTFLEYWKRKMATLAHHWDCMDFHEEEVT